MLSERCSSSPEIERARTQFLCADHELGYDGEGDSFQFPEASVRSSLPTPLAPETRTESAVSRGRWLFSFLVSIELSVVADTMICRPFESVCK